MRIKIILRCKYMLYNKTVLTVVSNYLNYFKNRDEFRFIQFVGHGNLLYAQVWGAHGAVTFKNIFSLTAYFSA